MTGRRPSPKRLSRAEVVADQVEEEILAARAPVGEHLGRRSEFMERFGISPMIMNETLRILRARGLVDVRPGTGGGISVASLPPQVRLGAMDLWFRTSQPSPLALFEARLHLEASLTEVAFERATPEDVSRMREALADMTAGEDARRYLSGVIALHRALVAAARLTVLDEMHQSIVAVLQANLSRAVFVAGHAKTLRHSVAVHTAIVDSLAAHDRAAFEQAMSQHSDDLVSTIDPRRSPDRTRKQPRS